MNEVALENNIRQMSSIDALKNPVHNTVHYADMTGDKAFLSLEIPSLRLCKSAKRV